MRMGLDAVVYRSKKNLPFDADALGATLDSSTGEYCFSDPAVEREFPLETRIALEKRIGNIALVAALRDEAEQALDENSVIMSKVLYSGTHAGDAIPLELMPVLHEELLLLREYAAQNGTEDLKQFVCDMEELVAAANREGNPIVF